MKGNKLILLSIVLTLSILLTGFTNEKASSLIPNKSQEQFEINKGKIMQEYLQKNYSAIDLKDESKFSDLDILSSDIKGKEMFFTAEIHGIKANWELNMKFLKYFKEKTDFKYYLCEMSYSDAYFIDKYITTGDERILEEMYKPLKGTFEWNKSSYNHWKKFYEYNSGLPKEKKMQIIGIDIEHQPVNAYRYLIDILPKKEAPKEIRERIDAIKNTFNNIDKLGNEVAFQCSRELQKDMEKKENIYKEYLGENFIGFKHVNSNVLNCEEARKSHNSYVDWNNTRDRMMYENFKTIYKELPKGKYYGQWGCNHVFQAKEKDVMWFASYLNAEDSILKDKILTIMYNYDNCEKMRKSANGNYSTGRINTIIPEIKPTNDLIGGDINIYKLINEDSPFSQIPMDCTYVDEKLEEKIVDFFQYIVCIKNSKATEPLMD